MKAVTTQAEVAAEAAAVAGETALIAVERSRCTPVVRKSSEPSSQVEGERLDPTVSSVEFKTVKDSNNRGVVKEKSVARLWTVNQGQGSRKLCGTWQLTLEGRRIH